MTPHDRRPIFTTKSRIAFAIICAASNAQGQSSGDEYANYVLEEIVVSAQKREENLQDVPISVTNFGGKDLENFRFFDNVDLASQVPNLTIKNPGIPTSNIFLRGIGSNDFNENTNNPVATYVDEVFLSSGVASNVPMFDLARVEVLKGPQGTLYGKNTTGGAISYVTRKPDGEFDLRGSATVGRFNEKRFEGAVGFPILEDVLAGRVSGYSNKREGTDVNTFDGSDQNQRDTQAIRGQLLYTPNDRLEALFKINARERHTDLGTGQHRGLVNSVTGGLDLDSVQNNSHVIEGFTDFFGYGEQNDDPYVNVHNGPDRLDIEDSGFSANISLEFDNVSLTSISAIHNHEQRLLSDPDFSPNTILHVERNINAEQVSQELRLASNDDGQALGWIAGIFYFNEEFDAEVNFDITRGLPGAIFTNQEYDQETTSYAAFTHVNYDFTDKLAMTAGLRYTYEERSFEQVVNIIAPEPGKGIEFIGDPGPIVGQLIPFTELSEDWSEVSGKISLDYRFNENVMAFGTVSRGFKTGGFTGGAVFNPLELRGFDPEILISYELGLKSEWFDNRVRFNATTFLYDYSDLQVFTFVPGSDSSSFVQTVDNAADASIYGLEIELTVLPSANWMFNVGIGLLESEYDNYEDPTGVDFTGNELVNAPKFDFNGTLSYNLQLKSGNEINFRTEFSYVSRRFFDRSNTRRLSSGGGHGNVNFAVAYSHEVENGSIQIEGWVKNALDEVDRTDTVDFANFGYDLLWFNDPRTAGITVSYAY